MKNILIGVLVVVVLVFGFLSIKGDKEASESVDQIPVGDTEKEKDDNSTSPVKPSSPNTPAPVSKTTITVPLVTENSVGADFGPFGCLSYIKFVEREVPQTQAVLGATYNWLFSNPASVGAYSNTIATQTNLDFQSVEIVNGTAKVYLTGSVMGNHCADATFAAQIQQAAFQYPTVSDIEVYVNGEIFDWCDISDADPEESGCDENPKLWNSQRMFETQ